LDITSDITSDVSTSLGFV